MPSSQTKSKRLNGNAYHGRNARLIYAPDWADVDRLVDLAKRGACTFDRKRCEEALKFITEMTQLLKDTAE